MGFCSVVRINPPHKLGRVWASLRMRLSASVVSGCTCAAFLWNCALIQSDGGSFSRSFTTNLYWVSVLMFSRLFGTNEYSGAIFRGRSL